MTIQLFLLVSYLLFSISLYLLFPKANEKAWKGLVPVLNLWTMCKIVGTKDWKMVYLLIPIVNIFFVAGLCVNMVRSFGQYKFTDTLLAIFYSPAIFFKIARNKDISYLGPNAIMEKEYNDKIKEASINNKKRELDKLHRQNPYKKSAMRTLVEDIGFAIFAAAFIRMFLIEAYNIPTSSMEGSLNVGDFLFVSKVHYGIRTPKTVLMIPLLHNRIPFLNKESYIDEPSIPFKRLPALKEVERFDPVVFNYPEGDSVYVTPSRTWSVYDQRRDPENVGRAVKGYKLVTRPVDKMDHYIKRCIGLPGDSLQIIDRQVYIDGQAIQNPTNIQFMQWVNHSPGALNPKELRDWGISPEDQSLAKMIKDPQRTLLTLNEEQKAKIKRKDPNATFEYVKLDELFQNPFRMFPHDPKRPRKWTNDNFGPIYIPKKGQTVELTSESLPFYERIIRVYEGNDLVVSPDGTITINGESTNKYTFQMNYYWMMGDNRHNSEDSRVWGFVPESHIVGTPLFIFFSTKEGSIGNGINWDRIFTGAQKM